MKTIEEKAKAYDEATKIIKANLGALNDITEMGEKVVNIQSIKNCFYRAFPELIESEDEKIRRLLIRLFSSNTNEKFDDVSTREIIAWLEKQGTSYTKGDVDNAYGRGIAFVKDELEKQTEQKPVEWTEKDKVKLFNIKTALYDYYTEENAEELMDWIKNHKPTIDETSYQVGIKRVLDNPESYGLVRKEEGGRFFNMVPWKGDNLKQVVKFTGKSPKFDEWFKTWEDFENYVHSHNNIFKIFNEDGSHYEVPVGAWIIKTPDGHNLPSKYTLKQKLKEWSEEDNKRLRRIIDFIWYNRKGDTDTIYQQEQDIAWLKSLRLQKCWKPTQEQMKHLAACIEESGGNLVLDSLYEQLKQLYYDTSRKN